MQLEIAHSKHLNFLKTPKKPNTSTLMYIYIYNYYHYIVHLHKSSAYKFLHHLFKSKTTLLEPKKTAVM